MYFNDFIFLLDISMKINLHVWFYFIVFLYITLYHLRDWSHGVERFALSEGILLCTVCFNSNPCSLKILIKRAGGRMQ